MDRAWAELKRRVSGPALRARLAATRASLKRAAKRRFDALRAGGPLHWASLVLVWGVFLTYADAWYDAYTPALTDPYLQTDDARTALFPFHRYSAGAPLANDPIANEMIEYQPYAFRALYRVTVPFLGLLAASKVAQAVCIAIVLAGGVALALSRRAGVAAGLLSVFVFLHDPFVMDRIGGGLPRSFGFPAIALWLAGAFAHQPWTRRAAAAIAALTYPSALAMVLGAEGLYVLRDLGRRGLDTTRRRVLHYAGLVGVCAALLAPAVFLGASDGGPVHTMREAREEPAFSKSGRLWLLPLGDPGKTFGKYFVDVFRPTGELPLREEKYMQDDLEDVVVLLVLSGLLLVPLLRLSPVPAPAIVFLAASLILYAVSVRFAFRLYSPERYYSFGMRGAALSLMLGGVGFALPRLAPRFRQPIRNAVVAGAIAVVWVYFGNGVDRKKPPMSMTIDYRRSQPLWEFIETLPPDARVASHIADGDDIPLFAKRANNGGFETLQPWLTKSWARQKARAEDTLRAFYATDRAEVLRYARKYRVSHLLVNRARYRADYQKRAESFEPLSTFARELLRDRERSSLVLLELPPEAVVFEHSRLALVDVRRLAQAWNLPP